MMDKFLQHFLMFLSASSYESTLPAGSWPAADGGSGEEEQSKNKGTDDPTPDPAENELGEGGKKALQAERDARKQADKRVAELETQLAQAGSANETALQEALQAAKQAQD